MRVIQFQILVFLISCSLFAKAQENSGGNQEEEGDGRNKPKSIEKLRTYPYVKILKKSGKEVGDDKSDQDQDSSASSSSPASLAASQSLLLSILSTPSPAPSSSSSGGASSNNNILTGAASSLNNNRADLTLLETLRQLQLATSNIRSSELLTQSTPSATATNFALRSPRQNGLGGVGDGSTSSGTPTFNWTQLITIPMNVFMSLVRLIMSFGSMFGRGVQAVATMFGNNNSGST